MKANYDKNSLKNKSNIQMNLYDMNKNLMIQQPDQTPEEIENDIRLICDFKENTNNKYYMLLCKDLSYYTIFVNDLSSDFINLGGAVINCVYDIGNIKSCDYTEDKEGIEIWACKEIDENTKEAYCMYLFPYDQGVVSYGN